MVFGFRFEKSKDTVPGDILLSTAFLSYVGCFSKGYRVDLEEKHWSPYFKKLDPPIPLAPGLDCMTQLTDDAQVAQWNNQGLPTDRVSTENATIMINSARWPLLIDPQLQGIKWVKNMYADSLTVIRSVYLFFFFKSDKLYVVSEKIALHFFEYCKFINFSLLFERLNL